MTLISILIPTYNRSQILVKNLKMLNNIFLKLNVSDKIEIIVSNNNSLDKTKEVLDRIKTKMNCKFELYNQDKNLGIEGNSLFLLSKSKAKYVMFLGDDDFLDIKYLKKVFSYLQDNSRREKITGIIPNFYGIDNNGNMVTCLRDKITKDKIIESKKKNFWYMYLAHQLSGVLFEREGVYEKYKDLNIHNIYPFMFFIGINIKRGCIIHITQYPVKVTQTNKKFWEYGNDGLLNDIMQNVYLLKLPIYKRLTTEMAYVIKAKGGSGFKIYEDKPIGVIKAIIQSSYISIPGKFYFSVYMLYVFLKALIRKKIFRR